MSEDNKAKVIAPEQAEITIEVAPEGVYMAFFPHAGRMALLHLDKIAAGYPELAAWIADRQAQAKGVDAAR